MIVEHASAIRRRAEAEYEWEPTPDNLRTFQAAGAQEMDIYLAGFDARHNKRNVTVLPPTPPYGDVMTTLYEAQVTVRSSCLPTEEEAMATGNRLRDVFEAVLLDPQWEHTTVVAEPVLAYDKESHVPFVLADQAALRALLAEHLEEIYVIWAHPTGDPASGGDFARFAARQLTSEDGLITRLLTMKDED